MPELPEGARPVDMASPVPRSPAHPRLPEGAIAAPPDRPFPETTSRRMAQAGMTGFYEAVADLVGLPVDAMTGMVNFLGSGARGFEIPGQMPERSWARIEDPIGGSRNIRQGMEAAGLITTDIQPGTEETMRRVGYEVGGSMGVLTGAGTAAKVGATGGTVTRPFIEAMRVAPGTTTMGELAGAAGAAVAGSMVAEAVPQTSPFYGTAQIAAELVGGGVPDFMISGAAGLYRRGAAVVDPFTTTGQRRAVAHELREQAIDPGRTIENLAEARPLETTGQASGDPGLVSGERALSAGAEDVFRARETEQNQMLREWFQVLKPDPGPGATQEFLRSRIDRLNHSMELHVAAAQQYADDVISQLGVNPNSLEANEIVRQALVDALQYERRAERRIWSAIAPEGLELDAMEFERYLDSYLDGLTVADRELIPNDVIRIVRRLAEIPLDAVPEGMDLNEFRKALPDDFQLLQPVEEYLGVRRTLSEKIRAAEATGNVNEARLLRGLRDDVVGNGPDTNGFLDNLDLPEAEGMAERYREARDFSRVLNDKFTRGDVGRTLGVSRDGGDIVPEAMTIEALFRSGERGFVSTQQMLDALGGREGARHAIENWAKNNFVDFATNPLTGRVDARRLARWRSDFGPALRNFPELDEATKTVFNAQRAIDEANALERRTRARIERAVAAGFVKADPQTAVRTALSGRTPLQNMQSLVRSARRDQSGVALEGLKRGFLDTIPAELSRLDLNGDPFLNPGAVRRFINNNAAILQDSGLFNQAELENMLDFTDALERSQRVALATPRAGSDTAPKMLGLNQILSRLYGIERGVVGPRFVVSEVGARAINFFAQRARQEHLRALLTDAYLNPDLARTLMMEVTPRNDQIIAQRLRTYLINNGYATEEELE